jgi:hypothetical protein
MSATRGCPSTASRLGSAALGQTPASATLTPRRGARGPSDPGPYVRQTSPRLQRVERRATRRCRSNWRFSDVRCDIHALRKADPFGARPAGAHWGGGALGRRCCRCARRASPRPQASPRRRTHRLRGPCREGRDPTQRREADAAYCPGPWREGRDPTQPREVAGAAARGLRGVTCWAAWRRHARLAQGPDRWARCEPTIVVCAF